MPAMKRVLLASSLLALCCAAPPAAAANWPLPPSRTGLLYLSGYGSNNLGEYLPDGTLLRTLSTPDMTRPRGVAVDDEGNLIVVCEGSARILRMDLAGNVLQTITHPDLGSGTGLAMSPAGYWYVGNFSPGRVLVFDPDWNHLATLTESGMSGVNCVSFDADGSFAVSAAVANRVYRFDAAHSLLGTVSHPSMGSPMSIASDSEGNHFLSNGTTGVVIKFDAGWNALTVFGAGVLSSPQGIAVDEDDRLTISNFGSSVVHRYDNQGTLLGSFALTGVTTARNLAFQTSALVLAREGSVGRANGFPEKVLTVNGSAGDEMGRMSLGTSDPVVVDLAVSSAGPSPAPYVLYATFGEPGLADVEVLPNGAGWFSFATPLAGATPITLVNSLGYEPLLGTGRFPSVQAPGTAFALPAGLGQAAVVTLQAVLLDDGSDGAPGFPYSATNAVVVTIS